MNIFQVLNSYKGNVRQLSITTELAHVLTENNKRFYISDKNTVKALSQPRFFDIITAAKQLV